LQFHNKLISLYNQKIIIIEVKFVGRIYFKLKIRIMKKVIIACIGIVLFSFVGCKQKPKPDSEPATKEIVAIDTSKTGICSNPVFKKLFSAIPYEKKLELLNENSKLFCTESFYTCVKDIHSIDETTFENYKKAYSQNLNQVDFYEITATNLKKFLYDNPVDNCYAKHLVFTPNGKTVTPTLVTFNPKNSCYSIPLINAILKEVEKDSNATLKFWNATVNGHDCLIFEVISIGIKSSFATKAKYDASVDPTMVSSIL
jgi:hypothetical protein